MKKFRLEEMGKWKIRIGNAIMNSDEIMGLLTGKDVSTMSKKERTAEFKKYVTSHLFINDSSLGSVLESVDSRIFYDIRFLSLRPQIKDCSIILYALCHRDILDTYEGDEYIGNRSDVLAQMIEKTLLDENIVKEFGIGDLSLDNVDIYNTTTMYGHIMTFSVPDFR